MGNAVVAASYQYYDNGFSPKKQDQKRRNNHESQKIIALLLALTLLLSLCACGSKKEEPAKSEPEQAEAEPVELIVFAAASMTETLNQLSEQYKEVAPNVTLVFNFDSSGTLKTQIQEGADCDLFISAAPKQMNALDRAKDVDGGNTEGLDLIDSATRINLLENKVALAVPDGNPKNIQSYDDLIAGLKGGTVMLAMGNSDVPVGQYT